MANYTIPDNPEYTTEIRKLENTDPGNAETTFNPLIETLIENTHAVKIKADGVDTLQTAGQAARPARRLAPISAHCQNLAVR